MRRAYIDPHVGLPDSFRLARRWARDAGQVTIVGPSTSAIEESPFLTSSGLPIGTTGNRHSRFAAQPRTGTVIAWCLHLDEVLELEERAELDGLVLVRGYKAHAPWITAHAADLLGGDPVAAIPEASAAIKKMVKGISMLPVLNQGLTDSRERSTAVQALTFMRDRGHLLVPEQLAVEAIRNEWPGPSPLELADLAKQLNAGKRLRYQERLNPAAMAAWASA
ncbi:hypothetical protein [Nocardioides aquiterrae]|uniref:AbiEi antitoxin C-terminal domain-containing protein n=1 Tax=Nocardioides aquiterrae TaxID=203799 RepID=A0ABN1U6G6_9ACTN